jgi:hypothetical protein
VPVEAGLTLIVKKTTNKWIPMAYEILLNSFQTKKVLKITY